jgi:hypothetical protein
MFPANIIQATMQQAETNYVLSNKTGEVLEYGLVYKDGANILGLVFFVPN